MCEAEPLCAENIGLKDIARSRRGELISRGELIMYYRSLFLKQDSMLTAWQVKKLRRKKEGQVTCAP